MLSRSKLSDNMELTMCRARAAISSIKLANSMLVTLNIVEARYL